MDQQTFLSALSSFLDVPLINVDGSGVFSIQLEHGDRANVDVTNWPFIRLYRQLELPDHGDSDLTLMQLLTWNMEWHGPSLACDEGETLYLVESVDVREITLDGFCRILSSFCLLVASTREKLADLPSSDSLGDQVNDTSGQLEKGGSPSGAVQIFDANAFA